MVLLFACRDCRHFYVIFIIGMVENGNLVANVVFLIGIIVANVPEGIILYIYIVYKVYIYIYD